MGVNSLHSVLRGISFYPLHHNWLKLYEGRHCCTKEGSRDRLVCGFVYCCFRTISTTCGCNNDQHCQHQMEESVVHLHSLVVSRRRVNQLLCSVGFIAAIIKHCIVPNVLKYLPITLNWNTFFVKNLEVLLENQVCFLLIIN